EVNRLAGALAARLFAGLLGPTDDCALTEGLEGSYQHAAEAVAVSDQHGERASGAVAAQCREGFGNDLPEHAPHGISLRPRTAMPRSDRLKRRGGRGTWRQTSRHCRA